MAFKLEPNKKLGLAGGYSVYEIRKLRKALREIEPALNTQFMRDVKKVGKPIEKQIKNAIPSGAPLSGMRNRGVMGWGVGKSANNTTIRFRAKSTGRSLTTNLLSIRLNSPAASMTDMAGRSGAYLGQGSRSTPGGFSREYTINGITRMHRLTRQGGQKFVTNLGRAASRYAWPAAEAALPAASKEVEQILDRYSELVSKKLGLS